MSDTRFGSWTAPESPVTIEYSLVVVEELRHDVAEGFQRLSRGGMEVGGALYGARDGRTVTILAMRPIMCEHARGPAFLLSDRDRELLNEQLERAHADPRLENMICVGWFLSHTRNEIMLTESDLEIYGDCFGAPWQVTLVIRPGRGGTMRAGFFVREADGTVKSESSYLEFNFPDRLAGVLDRAPRAERHPVERRAGGGYGRTEAAAAQPALSRESPQVFPAAATGPQLLPSPPPRSKWAWLTLYTVVVLGLAVWGVRYFLWTPRIDPIALSVLEHEGQLQIQWNHNARTITGASAGSLDITDGSDSRHVALSPKDLAVGSFTYQRNTGDIQVRMAVLDPQGQKIEERSQYLGSAPVRTDPQELKDLQQQRDDLKAEVERLRSLNGSQTERIQELERTERILQTRLGIK